MGTQAREAVAGLMRWLRLGRTNGRTPSKHHILGHQVCEEFMLDLLILISLAIAFAGAAGYVWACDAFVQATGTARNNVR